MSSKKVYRKGGIKRHIDETSLINTTEDSSQENSKRNRAKKYTKEENDLLVKVCARFNGIINKNSSSDADKKVKVKTWESIKRTFDACCRTEGIYVSFSIRDPNTCVSKF